MIPSRRGFVLPTTILVMTLLTVMLTAAFTLVSAEFRATDNSLATQRSLAIAQAGLQAYLSRTTTMGGTYDSVASYTFPGGYATVAASRMVPAVGSQQALWVVRSYGYATTGLLSGQVQARRVVAQLARYNPGYFPSKAALVAANDTEVYPCVFCGGGIPISGIDNCQPYTGTDTVGLLQVTGGYTASPASLPPPQNGIRNLGSATEVYDSSHVDWPGLLAGNFTPDYDVTGGTFPGSPTAWPIYYADGDLTLTNVNKNGILVVRGNLTMSWNAYWRGVVIVGGRLATNFLGLYYIRGTTITGLNVSTGASVPPNIIFRPSNASNGLKWDSCHLDQVRSTMSALAPLRNAWVDSWSLY